MKFNKNTNPKKENKENLNLGLDEINKNTARCQTPKEGLNSLEIEIDTQEVNKDSDVED